MKHFLKIHPIMYGLVLLIFSFTIQASTYKYSFVSDTVNSTITPISSNQTALHYYSFTSGSGHPPFGAENDKGFFWLYEDTISHKISLGLIVNKEGTGGSGGTLSLLYSGLPTAPNTFSDGIQNNGMPELRNNGTANWVWPSINTDGGLFFNLENAEWDIVFSNIALTGISNWYFLTNGENKTDAVSFDFTKGLTVSSNLVSPEVPIPAAVWLFGSGLIVLIGMRKKSVELAA